MGYPFFKTEFYRKTFLLFSVHGVQTMIITTSAFSVIKPRRLANIARTRTSVTSQLIVNSYFTVTVIRKNRSNYDTFCINVIISIFIYIYFIRQKCNHDEGSAKKYKGRNDSKQKGMDLLRRHFEMRPVCDKLWAIEGVMHLVN